MDQAVFKFLRIDHERLLDVIRNARSDAEIEAFTRPFVDTKSRDEIEGWNREWLSHEPEGPSREAFLNLRAEIAPDRLIAGRSIAAALAELSTDGIERLPDAG